MEAGLRRALWAVAATVAVVTAALLALPNGSLAAAAADDGATTLAAALASALAFRRSRRDASALAWRLLGLGLACVALGEAYWFANEVILRTGVPTVSLADAFYVAGYGLFLAALASWFPRSREPGAWVRRLLDFAIVGASLSLMAWIVALEDLVLAGAGDPTGTFLAASYPLIDLAIGSAFLLVAREVAPHARTSVWLVGLGIAAWAMGDLAYAYLSVQGDYASGLPLAAAWVGGYLLMAVGAMERPVVATAQEGPGPASLAWLPYYLAGPALLAGALRFAFEGELDQTEEGLVLGLVLALLLRQFILLRQENRRRLDLAQKEAQLAEAQAVAHIGSWQRDLVADASEWSDEVWRILGMEPQGRHPSAEEALAFVHPDDREAFGRAVAPILSAPGHFKVRHRVLRKDGAVRWAVTSGTSFASPDGKPDRCAGITQDVTELHEAEAALLAREALLLETQTVGRIGSWEIDLVKGSYTCSPENSRLFGIPHKAVHDPADTMRNLHPDDVAAVRQAIDATVRNGHQEILQRIVLPGGKLRYLRSRGELRKDPQGNPARIVGMSVDVTDQHEADQALQSSNERFRLAARATRDVIWDWDLATDRFVHSDNMLAVFGYPAETFSDSLDAFVANVHPEDVAALSPLFDILGAGGPSSFTTNYRFKHTDGTYRIVLDRAHILRGEDGRAVRVVGAMQDVTEERKAADALRASEERMRSLLENLEEVYISSDLVGGASTSSAAIEKLFGHPRAVYDADAMAWSRQIHPEDAAHAMAQYAELMAGTPVVVETRIVRADGAVRWIRASMRPIKDASGTVTRLDGVLRDITAEREALHHEEEIKRLRDIAVFKTQFLNNAAHELATPLTPIKLQMASLKRSIFGELTPRQAEAVGLLDRNLERLSVLVGDLLDAARLQGGRLKVLAQPVLLGAVAADVVKSFADKARQDGISLAGVGLSTEVLIAGDAARLNQVLFNLVHNALKFTPRGGRIEVSVRAEGHEAVVRVADSGLGLTATQIAGLFQPFTQVHDTVAHNVGGTGLGLYISKGIVEQHGGHLGCESPGPGQGATFEMRLPLPAIAPVSTAALRQAN